MSPQESSPPESQYKSLPALDKDFDKLGREIYNISDSVDFLYQQEDTEIEFMESFLDYDSISINGKEKDGTNEIFENQKRFNRAENYEKSKSLTLLQEHPKGLPPLLRNRKGKGNIQGRLKQLTSRSRQSMRNFGSRDSLQNIKEGLQKSKERLSSALSPARSRRGSHEWPVKHDSEQYNCRT